MTTMISYRSRIYIEFNKPYVLGCLAVILNRLDWKMTQMQILGPTIFVNQGF